MESGLKRDSLATSRGLSVEPLQRKSGGLPVAAGSGVAGLREEEPPRRRQDFIRYRVQVPRGLLPPSSPSTTHPRRTITPAACLPSTGPCPCLCQEELSPNPFLGGGPTPAAVTAAVAAAQGQHKPATGAQPSPLGAASAGPQIAGVPVAGRMTLPEPGPETHGVAEVGWPRRLLRCAAADALRCAQPGACPRLLRPGHPFALS